MKNMSMSMKIYCVLGILVLVAGIVSVLGINKLAGMNERIESIVDVSAEKVKLGARINQDLLAVSRAEKNIILAATQAEMDQYADFIAKTKNEMEERRETLRALSDDVGKAKLDDFAAKWNDYLEVNDEVRRLARLNSNNHAKDLAAGEGREVFDRLEKALHAIAEKNEQDFDAAAAANNAELLAEAGERMTVSARLLRNAVELQRAEKNLILARTQQEMDAYAQTIDNVGQEIDSRFAELSRMVDRAGKRQLDAAKAAYDKFVEIDMEVRRLTRENGNAKAFELASGRGRELADKAEAAMAAIVRKNEQDMATDKKLSDESYASARWILLLTSIIGIVGAASLAYFILRGINKGLQSAIRDLNEGSEQVAAASGQVSTSSQQLAEGSSEQASSLEETSSSLEEMSSQTKQNSENADQADKLMKDANQVVVTANDSMTDLTGSMNQISKASEETSKIIKTIDEIAFQTNLLALNAAVEAARAGEAGAGFAVVADEVRNLAMRAADAAKNTASLIEDTVKKVKDGGEIVTKTNEAFHQVADNSKKVGELVAEITQASKEQAQGIDQINKAMGEMDKATQTAAANSEESASASEELNAQAEEMKRVVQELSALVGGAGKNGDTEQLGGMAQRLSGNENQRAGNTNQITGPKKHGWKGQQTRRTESTSENEDRIPMDDGEFSDHWG